MKKISLFIMVISVLFALSACGSTQSSAGTGKNNNQTSTNKKDSSKKKTSQNKSSKKTTIKKQSPNTNIPVGSTEKSKIGVQTIVARQKGINKTYTSGPFKLTIEGYQVASLKPSTAAKAMFDGKSQTTIVTLKMKVENTSKKQLDFYPAQGTITTNAGDQAHAKTMLSGDVGGTFYGQVHKEGEVFFQVNSPAKNIKKVTFIVPGPNDQNLKGVGKQLTIDIPIK